MMKEHIIDIEKRIQAACDRAGRDRSEVTLIAVSKTQPSTIIEDAYHLGLRHFGENKVQELTKKQVELMECFEEPVYWHLIGHLQRNKVKQIIDKVELIHSVDSLRLGLAIEEEAGKRNLICDILVEVNIANEETKYGVSETEVRPLIAELLKLPHIRVRGLMAIAPYVEDPEKNRSYFKKLRELFIDIKTKNIDNDYIGNFSQHNSNDISSNKIPRDFSQCIPVDLSSDKIPIDFEHFDILSMGMTGDFEVAIEEGATMVRVGTGIFGERDYTKSV